MSTKTPQELLGIVSRSWIERSRAESLSTDWGPSLLMYGMLSGLRVQEDPQVREYLRKWLLFHLNERIWINYFCGSWSPALLYPEVIEEFPEVGLGLCETAERIFSFINHTALRNGQDVLLHNIDLPNIYIDTVYYSSVLLAKLGQTLGCAWQEDAVRQIERHLEILRDGDKPFCIHCQENLSGQRTEGSWARGNGWVMMTLAEVLPHLPERSEARMQFTERMEELAEALRMLQAPNGLWHTILDDRTSYLEASASAMFLFAFQRARRRGLLGSQYDALIERAYEGLTGCLDEDGRLLQVSGGTWPGTAAHYKTVPTGEFTWGTGAYLLALSESALGH